MCFLQFNHLSLSDKEIKMTSLRIKDKESKPVSFSGKDPVLKSYFKEVVFFSSIDRFLQLDTFYINRKISMDFNGLCSFFVLHEKSNKGHRKLMAYLRISDELT